MKLSISTEAPETLDEAGFEALEYSEVGASGVTKTTYTYKQVKIPVVAHEMAQRIAKEKGERIADTLINALTMYEGNKNA